MNYCKDSTDTQSWRHSFSVSLWTFAVRTHQSASWVKRFGTLEITIWKPSGLRLRWPRKVMWSNSHSVNGSCHDFMLQTPVLNMSFTHMYKNSYDFTVRLRRRLGSSGNSLGLGITVITRK